MPSRRLLASIVVFLVASIGLAADEPAVGTVPTDDAGRPLNLGFESGDLRDWTATGDAFEGTPIKGDVVAARRGDMKSGHAGEFWVGTYERKGDPAVGTLTSRPFKVSQPFASFLIGAGFYPETRVEIVRDDTKAVVFSGVRRTGLLDRGERGDEASRGRRDADRRQDGVPPRRRRASRPLGPHQFRRFPAPRQPAGHRPEGQNRSGPTPSPTTGSRRKTPRRR